MRIKGYANIHHKCKRKSLRFKTWYHYECSTYNNNHQLLVIRQISYMDALKTFTMLPAQFAFAKLNISTNCEFYCAAHACRST